MEGAFSYTTYQDLGGRAIDIEVARAEIARWPLDGILGFLGALSLEACKTDIDFYGPDMQGRMLTLALVDDFPASIPGVGGMIAPGRVPITGGRHIFMHTQNMAWLAHQALLYGDQTASLPHFDYNTKCRMARLLLIANDFLANEAPKDVKADLKTRRQLALDWLRLWQFQQNYFPEEEFNRIARQRILLLKKLPKYFDIEKAFQEVTGGISLELYFSVVALFTGFFFFGRESQEQWMDKALFLSQIKGNQEQVQEIVSWWITTPEHYRERYQEWQKERPNLASEYNFVPLRQTPIIEGRPNGLVIPVVHFFFEKVVNEPYFLLSERLSENDRRKFQQAMGSAFEDYAGGLIGKIAEHDVGGSWQTWPSPKKPESSDELSDYYLQRGKTGLAFEFKAVRPDTDFLGGTGGDKVLGPPDKVLSVLKQERLTPTKTLEIIRSENLAKGLIDRGMYQQSISGQSLVAEAQRKFGSRPDRIFPIHVHLADIRVDGLIYQGYLELLINRNQLYKDRFWCAPQWLHISDLENLALWAESGNLDLEVLVGEKLVRAKDKRFDLYLAESFQANKFYPRKPWLWDALFKTLDYGKSSLFHAE